MVPVDLQQLRYVIAIAETNSFTRAAERCLVVQSALSHQVARLERELGARLFDRTSRRVIVKESLSLTAMTRSQTSRSYVSGQMSSPTPSTRYGRPLPPE